VFMAGPLFAGQPAVYRGVLLRFDGRLGDAQGSGRVVDIELFQIAEDKNFAVLRLELLDRRANALSQFFSDQLAAGTKLPGC
jgi:hypothetical protein